MQSAVSNGSIKQIKGKIKLKKSQLQNSVESLQTVQGVDEAINSSSSEVQGN
jgi:hypothetical protein